MKKHHFILIPTLIFCILLFTISVSSSVIDDLLLSSESSELSLWDPHGDDGLTRSPTRSLLSISPWVLFFFFFFLHILSFNYIHNSELHLIFEIEFYGTWFGLGFSLTICWINLFNYNANFVFHAPCICFTLINYHLIPKALAIRKGFIYSFNHYFNF